MQSAQHSLIPVSSISAGKGVLFNLVEQYNLCQKLCGLFKSKDACFGYHISKCHGPCCGKETAESYNKRVLAVLIRYKYPYENFVVKEQGRTTDELSIIWVENSHYMGHGYIDKMYANSIEDLKTCVDSFADNKDIQKILRAYLRAAPSGKLIIY